MNNLASNKNISIIKKAKLTQVPEALIDIAGGIALTLLISFVFKKILPRLANKTKSDFDDFIIREITNLIFPLGSIAVLFLAERKLQLLGGLNKPYELILTIAAAVVFVRLINRLGIRLLQGLARRSGREDIEQLVRTLFPLLKALTWIVVSLIVLQSQGVKLTCLLYTSPSPRDRQKSRMPSSA